MDKIISGRVVRGEGYGRKIGFPTLNLDAKKDGPLKEGVYAGAVDLDGHTYRAGIVLGPGEKVEAHLVGYSGDAYGKLATFKLEKFIREYKNFETETELIDQIKKDLELCLQA